MDIHIVFYNPFANCKFSLFNNNNNTQIYQDSLCRVSSMHQVAGMSKEAKDFISRLLQPEPDVRPSASQVRGVQWRSRKTHFQGEEKGKVYRERETKAGTETVHPFLPAPPPSHSLIFSLPSPPLLASTTVTHTTHTTTRTSFSAAGLGHAARSFRASLPLQFPRADIH